MKIDVSDSGLLAIFFFMMFGSLAVMAVADYVTRADRACEVAK